MGIKEVKTDSTGIQNSNVPLRGFITIPDPIATSPAFILSPDPITTSPAFFLSPSASGQTVSTGSFTVAAGAIQSGSDSR